MEKSPFWSTSGFQQHRLELATGLYTRRCPWSYDDSFSEGDWNIFDHNNMMANFTENNIFVTVSPLFVKGFWVLIESGSDHGWDLVEWLLKSTDFLWRKVILCWSRYYTTVSNESNYGFWEVLSFLGIMWSYADHIIVLLSVTNHIMVNLRGIGFLGHNVIHRGILFDKSLWQSVHELKKPSFTFPGHFLLN